MATARSKRRWMLWILIPLGLYVLICLLVWLLQDALVFPGAHGPQRELVVPADVVVRTWERADGGSFRVASSVPQDAKAVVVFFVGNGEDLTSGVRRAADLARYGVAAVVPEYPGYGESEGSPSQASLFATAERAAAGAAELAKDLGVDLVVGGSSLGSFCAVHLASQGVGERMILKAPPTSLVAAGRSRFPWLPVSLFLRHRFDSLSLAPEVSIPSMVVHGDQDSIVPLGMGRRLSEAFAGPSEFVVVPGHGHNHPSLSSEGILSDRVRAFLRGDT